jgi:5'-nucleotidase
MFASLYTRARTAVAAGIGLALVGALAVPTAASADTGPRVVINEAYLKGGSAGAPFVNKFVELYNVGDAAQDLSGWSLQYRPPTSTGTASSVLPLTGSIAAGDHYLIQLTSNGSVGAALPTPDLASTSLNPGGPTGTLWIADTTTALAPAAGSAVGVANIVDLLGYGTSTTFEGAVGPNPGANSVQNSLVRTNFADTDDNSVDFTLATTVTPEASSGGGSTPTPTPTDSPSPTPTPTDTASPTPSPTETAQPGVTPIAEIQGTGTDSPLVGQTVTTRGVVTAAYPTGGFNGFYLQTAGTGGAIDPATHTASDGIFVYGSAAAAAVTVGAHVEVTGAISEYNGLTELTPASGGVTTLTEPAAPVTPVTIDLPVTAEGREALEGMLLAPTGEYTVTNTYSTNQYAEIGLAVGDRPLISPTEVAAPGTPEYDTAVAENTARAVTLDDGASINFLSTANKGIPLPYLTADPHISVGSAATFTAPVVLDYRNNAWKFQPTTQLTADGTSPVTFSDVLPAQPEDVGGDIQLASFNVLNYFTTTGTDFGCSSFYTDRTGDPVTVNNCGSAGPRGAAEAEDLERQQAKIVAAINGLGAEVVSLEEIENSVKFGKDRDTALAALVTALNVGLGADEQWDYVRSPATLPATERQDVIRTAFIYKKTAVAPVGESVVLDDPAFGNARQPLAQAFAPAGGTDAAFVAIVNHFKSKGDSDPVATGDNANGPSGAFNGDRVRQAQALVAFATTVSQAAGTERTFLLGDFNAYSEEDPIHTIEAAGYTDLGAGTGEYSYSFSGASGSLDHVFASSAAASSVTGTDIWNINSGVSIALEYSRHNYNATDFYEATPYRSSDHDPVVVGMNLAATGDTVELNILNINDFHGRIDTNTVKFAGTVEGLRAEHDNTVLLSAGDNVGASLFASASAGDIPTLDVLNALELKASAVGNHEFDRGMDDLTGRIAPAADFPYLGANVYAAGTTDPLLPEYETFEVDGLTVAVIGVVTEETTSLVSPGGIAGIEFGDPVDAVNRVAAELEGTADVIVAEYHDGAADGSAENATLDEEIARGGAFAKIVTQTAPSVDVIFTGHTHKEYVWDAPVAGTDRTRPVIQTGSYGERIGQVVLDVNRADGSVASYEARNVARVTTDDAQLIAAYPRVATVSGIVSAALAEAAVVGNQPIGSVTADVTTAFAGGSYVNGAYAGGARDDRASQSTLGNLVADSLVASLSSPDRGSAQIGVVNPGGLRAELLQAPDGVITYAEANAVLPFVNNLWTTTLTGAQFKDALEQQWQPDGAGRPYLQLGLSDNVRYTYDSTAPRGSRITGIWVDGAPIDPAGSYRIGSFNFLLQGGDNFTAFAGGTDTRDSGLIDRDAWIAYLGDESPVTPDFASRSAEVSGVPAAEVAPGDAVSLAVSGLNLRSLGAPENTTLLASIEGSTAVLDPVTVTGGAATVAFTVPADAPAASTLVLQAPQSGTEVRVPLAVRTTTVPGDGGNLPGTGGGSTPPTTTPQPATDAELVAALEGKIRIEFGSNGIVAGAQYVIDLGVEHAGEWVTVWIHSTPQQVGGWYRVDAEGRITVTLPAGVSGTHRLVVLDAAGEVIGWQEIAIADPAAAQLAVTGGDNGAVPGLLLAVGVLLGAGVLLRVVTLRRRTS